jgi:hypothetical protein
LFEVLLGPLNGLLDYFQKNRQNSSDEARHAEAQRVEGLQAMFAALIAAKKYQESNQIDRAKEFELSELWATAAIKSRKYLQEASAMNYEKARYWLDKLKWPEERFAKKESI